jgi:hypothetical protein
MNVIQVNTYALASGGAGDIIHFAGELMNALSLTISGESTQIFMDGRHVACITPGET